MSILAPAAWSAGVPQSTPAAAVRADQTSMYQTVMVNRTVKAVKYAHRSGSTKIDFEGTDLMNSARGEAKVDSHRGAMEVKAEFWAMEKPTSFGAEYLTYVLWAISPEGRQVNLGEILIGGNSRSKLDVTTDLQAFALIVTAEPYYAVRRPSNVVVMENIIRPDTVGTTEVMDAKYELIDRGGYVPTGFKFDPIVLNAKLPLEFFEARNALRIAQSAGAENYAKSSYDNAVDQMKQADDMAIHKGADRKKLSSTSRLVVQTSEDAREISVKHTDELRAEEARTADANRLASSQAETRGALANAADSDRARRSAEGETREAQDSARTAAAGQAQAERSNAAAQQEKMDAQAISDRERMTAEGKTREAEDSARMAAAGQAQAEQDNAIAQQQKLAAQADSDRNRVAMADANQAAANAQQGQRDAETESARSRVAASDSDRQLQQALRDREELRAKLLVQLNAILETRDTARGLVVNMSDVLFDSAKFTLRPAAREKLAKISGIVLAYPTLTLSIEGNTDSVGGDAYNQQLSESRAGSVRDYLATAGIPAASMTARGFGKTQPVASNDTAGGRQHNRRVELIVSGEVIGNVVGAGPTARENLPRTLEQK
ncbi:MAG TPA: OmpA family protein [Candidatus Acidoferrales bacterium]|nr:OmpA family protein [Candidatus Acidoferrales bacterium]